MVIEGAVLQISLIYLSFCSVNFVYKNLQQSVYLRKARLSSMKDCLIILIRQLTKNIIKSELFQRYLLLILKRMLEEANVQVQQKRKENKLSEPREKLLLFHNSIRVRQREEILRNIRSQYEGVFLKKTKVSKDSSPSYLIDQFPLCSKMLQKYHNMSHKEISRNLQEISQYLGENNFYLQVFMDDFEEKTIDNMQEDQQSLLIQDLLYLTLQHQPRFIIPKKFKFVRNADPIVANYVSIISNQIVPEQLTYWIRYMAPEDKELVYLNIFNSNSDGLESDKSINFHYQAWVNHPVLRNYILDDFLWVAAAAQALRDIIGFHLVHPDRFKNSKGQCLYEILCRFFDQQLQSMYLAQDEREAPSNRLMKQHLELSLKVFEARTLQGQESEAIAILINKIIVKKIEQEEDLLSPLFYLWVQKGVQKGLCCLNKQCFHILVAFGKQNLERFKISSERIQKLWNFYSKVKQQETLVQRQDKVQQTLEEQT